MAGRRKRHLVPKEVQSLTAVGSQSSVTIESIRLIEQAKRSAQRLALLAKISMAVTSTLNLDEILRTAVAGLGVVFEAEQCGVIVFDEERKVGRLVAEYPQRQETMPVAIPLRGNFSIERILATRQPLTIRDAQSDPLLASIWDVLPQRSIKSMLIVPLLVKGEVIGIISLNTIKGARVFTAKEIELAQTIANQISIAIDNARLYQQLIEEKVKTEIVLQETFSGIVMVDNSLRIVSLNPGAKLITGYPAEEVLGRRLHDVFGVEITAPGSPLAKAIESGKKVLPTETTLSGRHGARDVLLAVTPLSSAAQSAPHYLLSFADISKLKEVDRFKSSVVTNVSHELRMPLASIKTYTELLLQGAEGTNADLRREWLSVIDRETDRLTALINDFLSLPRLESGHFELKKLPLHLEEVIADVVASLKVQAERRNITIELNAQPGLPQLLADEGLIRIAVENLVSNALKFNHDGGHVHISVWEDSEALKFYVEDDGIGIPQDAIPHLFTRFFRVPSVAVAGMQGTGLGLALAKEAVAAHGGCIEVESSLGKGSRFTVTIPQTAQF